MTVEILKDGTEVDTHAYTSPLIAAYYLPKREKLDAFTRFSITPM